MFENYAGNLFFNDTQGKFDLQKDKIKTLTDENDIKVDTAGENNKYLRVKVADPGTLEKDSFQKSSDSGEFACMKTDYKKLDPAYLFSYIKSLGNFFAFNRDEKPQSYYEVNDTGFHELTKDEFYKS